MLILAVMFSTTALTAALHAVTQTESVIPHPSVSGVMGTAVSCAPTEIRNVVTKVVIELIA